jgi:hypothetical protein
MLVDEKCIHYDVLKKTSKGTPMYLRIEGMSYNDMRKFIDENAGFYVNNMDILGPMSDYNIVLMCKKPTTQSRALTTITDRFTTKKIPHIGFSGDKGEIIEFELKKTHPNLVYKTLEYLLGETLCDFEIKDEIPVSEYDSPFNEVLASLEDREAPDASEADGVQEDHEKPDKTGLKPNPDAPAFNKSYVSSLGPDGTVSKYHLKGLGIDCHGISIGIKKSAAILPESNSYIFKFREPGNRKDYKISQGLETVTDTDTGETFEMDDLGLIIKKRFKQRAQKINKKTKAKAAKDK